MKPLTETITWHPASEPPDDYRNVLLHFHKEKPSVGEGYYHHSFCRYVIFYPMLIGTVAHWAEMPKGPNEKG